jgi:hypothetical protein
MAKAKNASQVYELKITLANIKPPIWRRLHVKNCTLATLHNIIQACMGWTNSHMHSFEVGSEEYGEPDPEGMLEHEDDRKVKLGQIVNLGYQDFRYTYDFGDSWDHTIMIEKTLEPDAGAYPRCVAGKRACPPEDCGGAWGYGTFLETIQNPKHPEHHAMLEWIGGKFDPEAFDIDKINKDLQRYR